jgi:hypothetical protein
LRTIKIAAVTKGMADSRPTANVLCTPEARMIEGSQKDRP